MAETITEDGEIIETVDLPQAIDSTALTVIERAQLDTQIATARAYPRSIKLAISNILTLATLDEQTATECVYALKRGGKPLRGPSIRLAEIIQQQWGNNRVETRVVQIDRVNKMIVAEGMFIDLETNSATRASVQRRISGKDGRLFSDDMIAVTGNAACSIAKRNAILGGVPKGVWRKAFDEAERVIRGDVKTLVERRDASLKALAHFSLSPDQVFEILGVAGADDIDLDDLVTLRVIYSSLKSGEQTVEELLRGTKSATPAHKVIANPLADEPAKTDGAEGKPATPTNQQSAPVVAEKVVPATSTPKPKEAAQAAPQASGKADASKSKEG